MSKPPISHAALDKLITDALAIEAEDAQERQCARVHG